MLSGSLRQLLIAGFWVGLAFQTKMIQAWLVLPALAAAYLLAAPAAKLRTRCGYVALAGLVITGAVRQSRADSSWRSGAMPWSCRAGCGLAGPEAGRHAGQISIEAERFREITDHGVIPAPSGSGAVVIHAEEGSDCHVVLVVFRPADKARKIAIVTLRSCQQSVFGYPNDEAYWRDPRGAGGDEPGYGFYEVLSSAWRARLAAYNRHAFPSSTPAHLSDLRHFFIGCHDASGEFLAKDLTVEVTALSYEAALREAVTRTTGLAAGW